MHDDMSGLARVAVTIILIVELALAALAVGIITKVASNKGIIEPVENEVVYNPSEEDIEIVFNGNISENGVVISENYVENADKVINTDSYIDNSIINEAPRNSYTVPICFVALLAFIAIMYNMKQKAKRENDKMNMEILNTKFKTYEQEEIEQLKEKYK